MPLNVDAGNGLPTLIQDFDGFDVTTVDVNRWKTKIETGTTLISQSGGELVFANAGGGAGVSYIETIRKLGKNWRISTDLKLSSTTGVSGEISLVLYRDSNNYIKIGPYKTAAINCNCYMRAKINGLPYNLALTGDVVNTTEYTTYTIGVIADTILIYYSNVLLTSMPFATLHNYNVRIEAGTGANADTLSAKANDYEIMNHLDTLLMTLGKLAKSTYDEAVLLLADTTYIKANMNTGNPKTNISGNVTLTSTTEVFLEFLTATYGNKFRINLLGDLGYENIYRVRLCNGATTVELTDYANSLRSNDVPLNAILGVPTIGDIIQFYIGNHCHRLDVYMEGGVSNTDNTYTWEYYDTAIWQPLVVTDGTLYNAKVFGKSGSVTWATNVPAYSGNVMTIRARATAVGTSKPCASHIQSNLAASTTFDAVAAFLSSLTISIYRKNAAGAYIALPTEVGLPFTQCILDRALAITDLPCWSDTKIGFKLSATPTANVVIPYNGYVETLT
jgi:hypothetical protein